MKLHIHHVSLLRAKFLPVRIHVAAYIDQQGKSLLGHSQARYQQKENSITIQLQTNVVVKGHLTLP